MTDEERVPGRWLLHPIVLLSICTLGLNDHVLKENFPGSFTGKASDFAGMVFFPFLLLSVGEWLSWGWKGAVKVGRGFLGWSVVATGTVFALVNVSPACGDLYVSTVRGLWRLIGSEAVFIHHTVDPTDLVALSALAVPFWLYNSTQTPRQAIPSRRAAGME